jgi:hypothetical protein
VAHQPCAGLDQPFATNPTEVLLCRLLAHCRRSPATGLRSAHRCIADLRG